MLRRAVLLLSVLAGACAELPVLEPNTCGNGVLEGGEDCDLFPNRDLGEDLICGDSCRYVCDPNVPDSVCPPGWACGDDGVCRFPSGDFTETDDSPLLFSAPRLLLGDVDADGAVDVIGGNAASIELRFGSSGGALREPFSIAADFPIAPRALAHVGPGSQLDLLAPTQEGIDVYFGDEARRLVPAGIASSSASSLRPAGADHGAFVGLRAPGKAVDDVVSVSVVGSQLTAAVLDLDASGLGRTNVLGAAPGPAVVELHPALAEGRGLVAVAATGGAEIYVLALECAPAPDCAGSVAPRPRVTATVPVGHLGTVGRGTRLVDMDGDGVLDLLTSVVTGPGPEALSVALGLAEGGFDRAELPWAGTRLCEGLAEHCWPLAAADLNGQGAAELVLPTGVWSTSGGRPFTPRLAYPQLDRQGAAEILDVNGDARLDVVMASASGSVVQVLTNQGEVFNTTTLDVRRPVRLLRKGDFDGDGFEDVAIVQDTSASSFGASREVSDVSVIFGARRGGVRAPELMGRFFPIVSITQARLPSRTIFGDDAISDLLVEVLEGGSRRIAFMTGTGQGRLHAPLTLPSQPRVATGLPAAVLGIDVDEDGGRDLVAITFAEVSATEAEGPLMYVLRDLDGAYDLDATAVYDPQSSCLTREALGHGCLQAEVGTLHTARGVLAVNQREDCLAPVAPEPVQVTLFSPGEGAVDCRPLALGPAQDWVRPVTPLFADVAADPAPDAVVLFRGDLDGGEGGLLVWTSAEAAPLALPAPEGRVLLAAAALDVDADAKMELAVLAADGVYLLDGLEEGRGWPSGPTISVNLPLDSSASLGAADFDGDGLHDILVGTEERLSRFRARQSWLGGRPLAGP